MDNTMNTSGSSDSSSPRGFPEHATLGDEPNLSLSSQAVYASWEQSDIRGDLASGWGEDVSSGSLEGMGSAARAMAKDNINNNNNNMDEDNDQDDPWTWRLRDKAVHPVPAFYPMDPRSTRKLYLSAEDTTDNNRVQAEGGMMEGVQQIGNASEVQSIEDISHRISTACQKLSIQGLWDNMCPSATLCTMERVEMEITVYLGETAPSQSSSSQAILVELQRRKGCSVTFHNYRRHLLDAVEGKFDHENYNMTDGLDKPLGRDRTNQPRASLGRPGLARPSPSVGGLSRPSLARPGLAKPSPSEGIVGTSSIARPALTPLGGDDEGIARPSLRSPSFSAGDASMPIAGLKTEGDEAVPEEDTSEKAMKALNMAASLIRKDRVDARRLGMESLVLLTDPLRAGMETAKIASRVVLLGTAREEMVWESNDVAVGLGGTDEDGIDALFDESSGLGIRETILEMIMDEGEEKKTSEEDSHASYLGIEKEFTDSLFNLCLTVLSNALNTIEESAKASATPDDVQQAQDEHDDGDRKPSPRRRAATEPAVRPASELGVSKKFLDETKSTFGCDVLSSLIRILGQARTNPHDAYHSARCLGVLFKGCGNGHKARARRDLDAKRIIAAALEVGSRSHAKLADASRVAMVALVTDDEESMEEETVERTRLASPRRGREGTVVEIGGQQHEETQCELPSVMEQSQSGDSDER